jgi:hypothetical protein
LAIAIGSGCAGSGLKLSTVDLAGGNSEGSFDATVRYPSVVKPGVDLSLLRLEHRNVGGSIASYDFDVALERSPPGCAINNMNLWSDEQASMRIGSWPAGGFNLRSGESVSTVRPVSLAQSCRGDIRFAVVAIPKGGSPIVRHIDITVT